MSEPVKALWQDDAALFKAICEYVANERLVDLWEGGLVRQLSGDEQEAFRNAARTLPERLPLATPEMVECVNAVRQFGDFAGKVEAQSKQCADLSERFDLAEERTMCHGRLLLAAEKLAAIDAARAAGGAHA